MSNPKRLILIGFFLVLFGAVMPWFMVLPDMVEATFWLSFLIYGAQVGGLFMGIIGAAMLGVSKKKK